MQVTPDAVKTRRFRLGSYSKAIGVLAGGTALGQAVVVGTSPLLSRLYTPTDLGTLGVYNALVVLITIFTTLQFQSAIPLPRTSVGATNLACVCLLSNACFAILLFLVVLRWSTPIATALNAPDLSRVLWLLPLSVIGAGTFQAVSYLPLRSRSFHLIAQSRIARSSTQSLTPLFLGPFRLGALGLVLGEVLGQFAGSAAVFWGAGSNGFLATQRVRTKRLLWAIRRYIRFPLYNCVAVFLGTLVVYLPLLFLARCYSTAVAGSFFFARYMIGGPMTVLQNAVAQVYLAEISKRAHSAPSTVVRVFEATVKRLLLVALIPCTLLICTSHWVIPIAFGDQWHQTALFVQLLVPMLFGQFITSPVSQIANIAERQDLLLIANVVRVIVCAVCLGVPYAIGLPSNWAIGSYSLGMAATYFTFLCMYRSLATRIGSPE